MPDFAVHDVRTCVLCREYILPAMSRFPPGQFDVGDDLAVAVLEDILVRIVAHIEMVLAGRDHQYHSGE
jgi:hypothetical protein